MRSLVPSVFVACSTNFSSFPGLTCSSHAVRIYASFPGLACSSHAVRILPRSLALHVRHMQYEFCLIPQPCVFVTCSTNFASFPGLACSSHVVRILPRSQALCVCRMQYEFCLVPRPCVFIACSMNLRLVPRPGNIGNFNPLT